MNHEEVIKRFAARQINKRVNRVEWSGNNVFCRDNVVFSYGSHFPMAIYVGGDTWSFIRNSDKYSVSTSRHQGIVSSLCPGPALPRQALNGAGIPFLELSAKNILFWREGSSKFVFRNKSNGSFFDNLEYLDSNQVFDVYAKPKKTDEWEPTVYGRFRPSKKSVQVGQSDDSPDIYETGWFTVDQVAVLTWKRKFFLVFKNEVSRLPKKPETLSQALEMLATSQTKDLFSKLGSAAVAALS